MRWKKKKEGGECREVENGVVFLFFFGEKNPNTPSDPLPKKETPKNKTKTKIKKKKKIKNLKKLKLLPQQPHFTIQLIPLSLQTQQILFLSLHLRLIFVNFL